MGIRVALIVMLFISTSWTTVGARHASPLRNQRTVSILARLSFYVPSARMAEFEAAYEAKLVPILKQHGLMASSQRGRVTPGSVFSRLFEVKSLSEMVSLWQTTQGSPAWQTGLQEVNRVFGNTITCIGLELYATPATSGKVVRSGSGTVVRGSRGQEHWRTYDVTDGLANNGVMSILQDQAGMLWFATAGGGVSRYDGQTWTTFTTKDGLAHNMVPSMFQDRSGVLWFGTLGGGVSRYDGQTWTTFTTKDGLANNQVWSMFQDRSGVLWFGTLGGGVSRYDGQTWTTFTIKDGLAGNVVFSIGQDGAGVFWFGTVGEGVSRYDGQTWTTFTTKDGLAGNMVRSIFQDRSKVLWFGTGGGGVSRYDGQTWTTFTTKDGLAGNIVRSIFQDRSGVLWFGTEGEGVSRYDGQTWTTFTTKDGLVSDRVYSILQDRAGIFWFSTPVGVSRYDGQTWTIFSTKEGLANVRSMLQDRGGMLWVGTEGGGVSRYDGQTWTTFTTKDGLAGNIVRSILQDRAGMLWFGTVGGGVSRYDGQIWTTFTTKDGLTDNVVYSIFEDRAGMLWFGTYGGGVSRYDGQTWTTFTTRDGLAGNIVYSIFQDRTGVLWFGTVVGVSRYDGQTWTTFTTKDGLGGDLVLSVFQDRTEVLWFGVNGGGVSQYDGQAFTTFTIKDGLAGNSVWSIFQDREGMLWFGTEVGVNRYDGQVFQSLTSQDGLAGRNVWSILQDQTGPFWFGTIGGVTRYRPPAPWPPSVSIDAVVADQRYEKISQLAIPSIVKLIVFEFRGGMNFTTRPEQMVYRYRLKGYDADWKITHVRRVEYQDLPRGTYTFEVVAVDRDLVYSKTPATVMLRVHLPYERIGWISALSIALALIAWQAGRIIQRDRKLQESNRKLDIFNQALSETNQQLHQKTVDLEQAKGQVESTLQHLQVTQAQLVQSEKMAALGQLTAGVAHEIKNPLNFVNNFARLSATLTQELRDELSAQKERIGVDTFEEIEVILQDLQLNVEKIDEHGRRADSIVRGMLMHSRGKSGERQLADLNGLVDEAVHLACHGMRGQDQSFNIAIQTEYDPSIGQLEVIPQEVSRVFLNVVNNACYAVHAKRKARGDVFLSTLTVRTANLDDRVEVRIRDNGTGIPAGIRDKIFDPFFTTKPTGEGTGLGLSISYDIVVKQHQGDIRVESEEGSYTEFIIGLPKSRNIRSGN